MTLVIYRLQDHPVGWRQLPWPVNDNYVGRLEACTGRVTQGAQLLEPIYEALLESIRTSRVKAMDEVPIKAGLSKKEGGHGKMGSGYFWPIYGEHDEVCFPYFESRRAEHVQQALGLMNRPDSVLLTNGYAAYSRYAKLTGVTHAQRWAHTRRGFFEAQDVEPEVAAQAIEQIAAMYKVEDHLRQTNLKGEAKRLHRLIHSKPVVEQFFPLPPDWAAARRWAAVERGPYLQRAAERHAGQDTGKAADHH